MHENLVLVLYSLVQLHRWSKVVLISAFYIVTGLFDWLWCVFVVFHVIRLLFVNHLKDFFVIYRLPDDWCSNHIHESMVAQKTWVWTFSTIIYEYIYICIYIHGNCCRLSRWLSSVCWPVYRSTGVRSRKRKLDPKLYWPVSSPGYGNWHGLSSLSRGLHTNVSHHNKTSTISRTKSQNLNVSCIPLQLSSLNPLKPGVKLRMKM